MRNVLCHILSLRSVGYCSPGCLPVGVSASTSKKRLALVPRSPCGQWQGVASMGQCAHALQVDKGAAAC